MKDDDMIITGSKSHSNIDGIITGSKGQSSQTENKPENTKADRIFNATQNGGLDITENSFNNNDGDWDVIKSSNYFEVLYLDYTLYKQITPELVGKNYNSLVQFWGDVQMRAGRARQRFEEIYGSEVLNQAKQRLDRAYASLKSKEGIEAQAIELDNKRIANGLRATMKTIEICLADGDLTSNEALLIIKEGKENKLTDSEIRDFLQKELIKRNFSERATVKSADFLQNRWMTDDRYKERQKTVVKLSGTEISSGEEMATVLFGHQEKSFEYLQEADYIRNDLSKLEGFDLTNEIVKIVKSESDIEKRYLKVIYRLNGHIPFRLNDQSTYANIADLLHQGFKYKSIYDEIYGLYQNGHLEIWLAKTDPDSLRKMGEHREYNEFLKFIYSVEKGMPYYLGDTVVYNPMELAAKADEDIKIWKLIIDGIKSNELFIWLIGSGNISIAEKYNVAMSDILDKYDYEHSKIENIGVEELIRIINPGKAKPEIAPSLKQISHLDIQGGDVVMDEINIGLISRGYTIVKTYISPAIDGMNISDASIELHSVANKLLQTISVSIDSDKLTRNTVYESRVIVETIYETIEIPISLKVIFPKRAFIIQLAKYIVLGGVFMASIRAALNGLIGINTWLCNGSDGSYASMGNERQFGFFIVFALLAGGLTGCIFLIRKLEKI